VEVGPSFGTQNIRSYILPHKRIRAWRWDKTTSRWLGIDRIYWQAERKLSLRRCIVPDMRHTSSSHKICDSKLELRRLIITTYFNSLIIEKRSKPVCTGSHSQAATTPVYSTSLRRQLLSPAQALASHRNSDAYLYSGRMKSAMVWGSAS
jgi:hypothetical protein